MHFTNGSSCAFEMLMRGKPITKTSATAGVPTVRIAIPVTFTVRIGSISSVCTRNVRMSRAN